MRKYDYCLPNAMDLLKERCFSAAHAIYGETLPFIISNRLAIALSAVEKSDSATSFLITAEIADYAKRFGYHITTRGKLGSILLSWLLGISEVNPLPAHYVCGKCHHFELFREPGDDSVHGFDLDLKKCPVCGETMVGDGAGISPEISFGRLLNRQPDIALNCSPTIRKSIMEHLDALLENARIIRAGISRMDISGNTVSGVHPGGFYIVPKEMEIEAITSLRNPEPDDEIQLPVTVRDYTELNDDFTKYDLLSLPILETLHTLEEEANVQKTVNHPYRMVHQDAFPLTAICKCGMNLVTQNPDLSKQALAIVRPRTFSDFVKVIGLLHDSDFWKSAKILLSKGLTFADLIVYRDDLLSLLVRKGVDEKTAFRIINQVKSGKGLTGSDEQLMKSCGISLPLIESFNNHRYLFPRSHGVEYAILYWKTAFYLLSKAGPNSEC